MTWRATAGYQQEHHDEVWFALNGDTMDHFFLVFPLHADVAGAHWSNDIQGGSTARVLDRMITELSPWRVCHGLVQQKGMNLHDKETNSEGWGMRVSRPTTMVAKSE